MSLPRLLLVTDRRASALPVHDAVSAALSALPHGSAIVLLREKDLAARELLELARVVRTITSRHGALLALSSRLDLALACGADALQLGHDAPPFDDVRRLAPASLRLGVSLHGEEPAPDKAAWALLSPVFPTTSKPGAVPLGLERLRASCSRLAPVPVFALGGVDASNVAACLDAGAWGVATRGAVLSSSDPKRAALALFHATRGIIAPP